MILMMILKLHDMANYTELKTAVSAIIKTNNNQEITGQLLQDVLNNIISVIGANATFAGIATPDTAPGTPDQNVFYIAGTPGEYANFGLTVDKSFTRACNLKTGFTYVRSWESRNTSLRKRVKTGTAIFSRKNRFRKKRIVSYF